MGTNRPVQWHDDTPPYELDANGSSTASWCYNRFPWASACRTSASFTNQQTTTTPVTQSNISQTSTQKSVSSTQSPSDTITSLSTLVPKSMTSTSSPSVTSTNPKGLQTASSILASPAFQTSISRDLGWGIIGGVLFLILCFFTALFLVRRRRDASTSGLDDSSGKEDNPLSSLRSNHRGGPAILAEVATYQVTPPSMITAPANEDEEYYRRVVSEGQGVYIQNGGSRDFHRVPEVD